MSELTPDEALTFMIEVTTMVSEQKRELSADTMTEPEYDKAIKTLKQLEGSLENINKFLVTKTLLPF